MRKQGDDDRSAPSAELVRELEEFGYKAAVVARWTTTRARLALAKAQKDRAITIRRAVDAAKLQGAVASRPAEREEMMPNWLRPEAAGFIEECLDRHDLSRAIEYSLAVMTPDELRRLGGYLARLLRGEANSRTADRAVGRSRSNGEDDSGDGSTGPGHGQRPGPQGQRAIAAAALPGIED